MPMIRYRIIEPVFCALLLVSLLIMHGNSVAASVSGYSIVLASAKGEKLKWNPENNRLFESRTVYVEQVIIKGSTWERLCLGFFDKRETAVSVSKKLHARYPGAWVQKASTEKIVSTFKPSTAEPAPETSTLAEQAVKNNRSTLSDEQLNSLMERARTDFKNNKYSSAIRYLNAVTAAGNHKYSRDALELLGLARQRKGQKAHAVSIYENYLERYPEGEGSVRVRQRLAGLLTASRAPEKKTHSSTDEEQDKVITSGSLSQFYLNNQASTDSISSITTLSQLVTYLELATIHSSKKFDHHYQITADHNYDFIDSDNESDFRFIETWYESSYRKTGSSARLGRQKLRTGGILKRFDGILLGYQFTPDMRLNVLGGLPVDIDNKSSLNKHKSFYGFIFETGTFLDHWDMNLFYFDQENDGLTDRNSIGTEVRYRDKTRSLFGTIDYDLFYEEVNLIQLNTSILLDHGRTAYLNAIFNKAPLLSTDNALIGRPETSLDELKQNLNVEQIYQLARDRTADSQTISIGASQALGKNYRISADITATRIGETEATAADAIVPAGIAATEEIGPDYFLSTQLVGNRLFTERDSTVFGLRYYQTEPSDTVSFIINTRFPLSRNWRLNPRLQLDIRKLSDGSNQEKLRARLKTDYRYLAKVRFDFEIGYDDTSNSENQLNAGNSNLFLNLGYRWDF